VVLGQPRTAEAELVGGLGDLDATPEHDIRRLVRRRLQQQERSELDPRTHEPSLRPANVSHIGYPVSDIAEAPV
jgi:hypothetical protein